MFQKAKSVATTLYNHKKKVIFASLVGAYGLNYGRLWIRDLNIRSYYANQAVQYGTQIISMEENPRRITVVVNKAANTGSGWSSFQKNGLPLLNLAGIAVNTLITKNPTELQSILSVIGEEEADGVIVVGGDGTLNDALAGLVQRDPKAVNIPVGIYPGGRSNFALKTLVPDVFETTGDVRAQCESVMAVIEYSHTRIKPVRVELTTEVVNEQNEPLTKVETFYTVGDVTNGWFSYIENRKWKFWYWGGLRRRFAYFWEMLKASPQPIRTEITLTDYCSGCNKCRTPYVAPKTVWKWWHVLLGPPKPKPLDPSVINYNRVINENCGTQRDFCTQGTDLVISNEQHPDACELRLRVGNGFAGRSGVIADGWSRASTNAKTTSSNESFHTTNERASKLDIKFIDCPDERVRTLFVGGTGVSMGEKSSSQVKIEPIEASLNIFLPKSLRVGLEGF